MRVFVGISEVANLVNNYAKGFRALGLDTHTLIGLRNPFYPEAKYDVVLSERIRSSTGRGAPFGSVARSVRARIAALVEFVRALKLCDVFVYITGGSVLPGYLDYPLIKLSGKRLVVAFAGSEIRHWFTYESEMKALGYIERVRPFVEQIKQHNYGNYFFAKRQRVRQAERWADLILSQPGYAQLQKKPYMRVIAPLDLSELHYRPKLRAAPLVVHAPTACGVKGTDNVLAVVEELRREGIRFEFRLIEKMPHLELCRLLEDSDIVVDELYADTVGVLSAEAMATGNVALTSYFSDYARTPAGCPVLDVHTGNLKSTLRRAILDRELRAGLTECGRRYVEQHHDCAKIARQILGWLEPGGINAYDFVPKFHEDLRVPDEVLREERKAARRERRTRYARLLRSVS